MTYNTLTMNGNADAKLKLPDGAKLDQNGKTKHRSFLMSDMAVEVTTDGKSDRFFNKIADAQVRILTKDDICGLCGGPLDQCYATPCHYLCAWPVWLANLLTSVIYAAAVFGITYWTCGMEIGQVHLVSMEVLGAVAVLCVLTTLLPFLTIPALLKLVFRLPSRVRDSARPIHCRHYARSWWRVVPALRWENGFFAVVYFLAVTLVVFGAPLLGAFAGVARGDEGTLPALTWAASVAAWAGVDSFAIAPPPLPRALLPRRVTFCVHV